MAAGSLITPVLRSFDEAKAREFYVDFLGFEVDFEHRVDENTPLYVGLSGHGVHIHLSEHHGDASPGTHIRITIEDVKSLCAALNAKTYKNARPVAHEQPWGSIEMTISDPFSNRITFTQTL